MEEFFVSGVISFSKSDVNDVITSNVDTVHVVIRNGNDVTSGLSEDTLYADIPSYPNIEVSVFSKTRTNKTRNKNKNKKATCLA